MTFNVSLRHIFLNIGYSDTDAPTPEKKARQTTLLVNDGSVTIGPVLEVSTKRKVDLPSM